jgi:ribosomal protein S18 acetylase RimI-like enzyme
LKYGVGRALMDFSIGHSIKSKTKSIRLDVYEGNIPVVKLYEKLLCDNLEEMNEKAKKC